VGKTLEVLVPDIGDFHDVGIIEVLVAPGDQIQIETPLITLESDKASMDVPSPQAGRVREVQVKVGDRVSQGSSILLLEVEETEAAAAPPPAAPPLLEETPPPFAPLPEAPPPAAAARTAALPEAVISPKRPPPTATLAADADRSRPKAHASPSVRRFARELGVDLSLIMGTGRKGRILKEDVQGFVKEALAAPPAEAGGAPLLPEMPSIDFSKFGEIETRPLSRIKILAGTHLHRSWLQVPHVTQHDEADITELEAFRQSLQEEAKQRGVRMTLLPFLMKAAVAALKVYPACNASLDSSRENLILKHYYHIGVAVDTAEGLVVPVIRDVERKGIFELATELTELSAKARERKLTPSDLQGGSFTISSLGGIGGTAFTPIVNAPEVAILGVSRASLKPVYRDGTFLPRLLLPLSLSYDHRVIDGAQAARFTNHLQTTLSDLRRLLL
jgi:pyruvate dehydrogenase E2 component (dihydrolipoamide acetyltransferase)